MRKQTGLVDRMELLAGSAGGQLTEQVSVIHVGTVVGNRVKHVSLFLQIPFQGRDMLPS